MTYRGSAFCLDCEEHESLYLTDCCGKYRPGCAIIHHRDTGDGLINAVECRDGQGHRAVTA
jgi:hypothetical protein